MSSVWNVIVNLFSILLCFSPAEAIHFDLPASPKPLPKCITNYIMDNTLVVVTAKVGLGYNQRIDLQIFEAVESGASAETEASGGVPSRNEYGRKKNVENEYKMVFHTHSEGDVAICFTNTLEEGVHPSARMSRSIELDVDIGAEAQDYSEVAKKESLSQIEQETLKLEGMTRDIVDGMDYLKRREARMRDTNESTNERVKYFSLLSLIVLLSVGSWQVYYLRLYVGYKNFRAVKC